MVVVNLVILVEVGVVEQLLLDLTLVHLLLQEEVQVLQTILILQQETLQVEIDIILVEVIHLNHLILLNL